MKIWNSIKRFLGILEEHRHVYILSPTKIFMELDVERLKRNLKLEEEAKTRAELDQPRQEVSSLDDIEQRVISTIEGEKKNAHDAYLEQLKTYGDRIKALAFQTKFAQMRAAADSAISTFRARVNEGADRLFQSRRDVVRIDRDIEEFKKESGIRRMAQNPDSLVWHFAVLLVIWLIESALNGVFLAKGHQIGIIGGFGEAIVIALFNIIVGVSFGRYIIKKINHIRATQQILGALGALFYLALLVCFNLGVAHYRDALTSLSSGSPGAVALRTLLEKPFSLASIESWGLFAIGCIFSIIAAADGWAMDDPYPGYGKLARHQEKILNEYVELKADLMSELEEVRNRAIKVMESAARDIENRRSEYHAILEARKKLDASFTQYLSYLEQVANDLLTFYREANRRARNSQAPSRFSERWSISPPAMSDGITAIYSGDTALEQEIARAFAELTEKQMGVHKGYEEAVFEYKKIEELTPEAASHAPFQTV